MHAIFTLEEVGKQFDVTRERIRRIEAKTLRGWRHGEAHAHDAGEERDQPNSLWR